MKRYVIPKNLNKGDYIVLKGKEVEILEIDIIKKLRRDTTMPFYNITYEDIYKNKENTPINSQLVTSHTVVEKIDKPTKKRKGLKTI
jgi:hypothetical protein